MLFSFWSKKILLTAWVLLASAFPLYSTPANVSQAFFTTSDGVKLRYLEAGQGQAILFIPGWLMPAEIWELQIRELSQSFRVLALDPRSQGQSDLTSSGNTPQRRAQDIRELMDHLQIDSVVLVGWSLGAFDCLAYLRQFGDDRLFALALVDSPLGAPSGPKNPQRSTFLKNFQADRLNEDRNYTWGLFKHPTSAEFFKTLLASADRVPTNIALDMLDNTQPGDAWQPSLRTLQGISLLYAITPKFSQQGDYLKQNVPQARVELFAQSGHALFVDDSKRFNTLLEDFIWQSSLYTAGWAHPGRSKIKGITLFPTPVSTPSKAVILPTETQTPVPTDTQVVLPLETPTFSPTPFGPPERIGPPAVTDTATEESIVSLTTTSTVQETPNPSLSPVPFPEPSLTPVHKGFLSALRSLYPFHTRVPTLTETPALTPTAALSPAPSPTSSPTLVPMLEHPYKINPVASENPIQDGYFYTSDHVKLHYLEAGQGLALVFIPGWLIPAEIWDPQLKDLSSDYHVIALDPRSQGESDMTSQGDEPLRQARDIQELFDHLNLSSVVLIGWSHGGFQVLSYMNEFGTDRLYAACLVDSALAAATPVTTAAEDRFLQEFKTDRPHAVRGFVWSLFKTPPPTDFFRHLADMATRTPTDIALALMNNVFPGDAWQPNLMTICQVPLLYAVTPKYTAQSAYLSKVDPLARVEIFPNAGHALFYDEPDHFNTLLRDFLGHASLYPSSLPTHGKSRKKGAPSATPSIQKK